MLIALLVSLAGLAPDARATQNLSHEEFFKNAKPLITEFVAAKSAEYDIDLQLDDSTWAVMHSNIIRHPMGFDLFYGGRYDWECRIVSAVIKGTHNRRAHFSVRVSYPENGLIGDGENAHYELVPTCNRLDLKAKTLELRVDGLPKDRDFTNEEISTVAVPLIQNFLKDQGKSTEVDLSSITVRRRGVDAEGSYVGRAYRAIFGRNMACRRVRIFVPGEKATLTTYVSVFYNAFAKVPYLPESTQAILKDKMSLRPYRFALVAGCDNLGLFEKPTLILKPSNRKSTPSEPTPAPESSAPPVSEAPTTSGAS